MKCLNWKVVAALAAMGTGLYVLAPGLAAAAVPLLVLVACPLSMLLMMRAMSSSGRTRHDKSETNADELVRLRAEVAEVRQRRDAATDGSPGRR